MKPKTTAGLDLYNAKPGNKPGNKLTTNPNRSRLLES